MRLNVRLFSVLSNKPSLRLHKQHPLQLMYQFFDTGCVVDDKKNEDSQGHQQKDIQTGERYDKLLRFYFRS
jgi:hypothetical protein